MKNRYLQLLINILISISAISLVLLIAEIGMRIYMFAQDRNKFENIMAYVPPLPKDKNLTLGYLIKPSTHPKIIYELRPNLNVRAFNSVVQTNAQGWRSDKDYSVVKSERTVRIIGIGDSYMFGQGVDQGKDYLSVLQDKLNANFPQQNWEIINTAVPGYNTVMEVETLERRAIQYDPDIVIMEFIANDMELPNFIYCSHDWKDPGRVYFLEWIAKRLLMLDRPFALEHARFVTYGRFESDPANVADRYKQFVGWDAFRFAVERLKDLQIKHDFDVIVMMTFAHDAVAGLCRRIQFYIFDEEIYDWHNLSHNVSKKERHPTEFIHAAIADALLHFLIEHDIIDTRIAETREAENLRLLSEDSNM